MEQWKNKVAIVTGASAGIGESIVVELVKCGIHVVALARREDKLQELAKSLNGKEKHYGSVYTKVCDVTDENSVKNVFSWADSTLGGVSILINNAGVAKSSSLLDGKLIDWQCVMNLNVLALSVCSREAYKIMSKNNIDGHIVQVNSIAGHCMLPGQRFKMYNASKTAVTVLCDGLRHELQLVGSKIKVSSISPGAVMTDLLLKAIEDSKGPISPDQIGNITVLQGKDVANAVMSILSTPPNVLIAELVIIPNGSTIQPHNECTRSIVPTAESNETEL